ncbi:histamine H2 receptor-like [Oculina patagonica]
MNNSTVVNDTLQEDINGTDFSGGAGLASNGLTTGIVVNTFLIVLIVGGNLLVVAAYAKNRRLRTGTYALMVSLALSDLLVGGVAIPIRIYGSVKNWQVSFIFNLVFTAFDIFSAVASNLHLMALSFERFVAVSRPFYHQTLTVRPYAFASMMSWILAVVAASLHPQNYFQNGDDIAFEAYTVTLFALCFLGPLTVISIVNIGIFRIARVLIQRAPLQDGNDMGRRLRKERKAAFTLLFMTGFFFIAWFPFFVMNMLFLYCIKCLPSTLNDQLVMVDIIKCLHYSNSAINPVIYAFRDIEMRRTFARLLGPLGRLCRVNQVEPEYSNTQVVIDLHTRK